MQLNIILMEFLRNTTISLGDVYISKKKIKLKVLDFELAQTKNVSNSAILLLVTYLNVFSALSLVRVA